MDYGTSYNRITTQADKRRTQNYKIMFWNIRGITGHMKELQNTLKDFDIFISVETWLKQNVKTSMINFHECFSYQYDYSSLL